VARLTVQKNQTIEGDAVGQEAAPERGEVRVRAPCGHKVAVPWEAWAGWTDAICGECNEHVEVAIAREERYVRFRQARLNLAS
jgi:hypothetical protein